MKKFIKLNEIRAKMVIVFSVIICGYITFDVNAFEASDDYTSVYDLGFKISELYELDSYVYDEEKNDLSLSFNILDSEYDSEEKVEDEIYGLAIILLRDIMECEPVISLVGLANSNGWHVTYCLPYGLSFDMDSFKDDGIQYSKKIIEIEIVDPKN